MMTIAYVFLVLVLLGGCSPVDAANEIDVFLVAGQSNAQGAGGNIAEAPSVSNGAAFYFDASSGTVKALVNNLPKYNSTVGTGTQYPQFAITYHQLTGRTVGFINAAQGSSGQTLLSDSGHGNWGRSGTLVGRSLAVLADALTAFEAAGYTPRLRGVLWNQGENDAATINTRKERVEDYQSELQWMIGFYRQSLSPTLPFFIFETGTARGRQSYGYQQVRQVQEAVAYADQYTYVVFRSAVIYPDLGFYRDDFHYNQKALNVLGTIGANQVAYILGKPLAPESPFADVPSGEVVAGSYVWLKPSLRENGADYRIVYAFNGSPVRCNGDAVYRVPIQLNDLGWIEIDALVCTAGGNSALSRFYYRVVAPIQPPTASVAQGTYDYPVRVELTAQADSIRYTISDHVELTCLSGTIYTAPFMVSRSGTLRAVACTQSASSDVASYLYEIK